MGWRPDHRLVVSTRGPFTVPGWRNTTISGRDEDLIVLINQAFGEPSEGYWQLYFDGSDVELRAATEDVRGIWIEPVTDRLYLATEGAFSVTDASGDASDILACDLISAGRNTRCSFSVFWRGQEHGLLNQHVDGLQFGFEPRVPIEPASDPNAAE